MWNWAKNASTATLALVAIIPAVVLFVASMLVVSLLFNDARIDLTENNIYTVTQSTRDILAAVEDPITLKLYLSSAWVEEAPAIRVYSERVTELLRAYESLSDGMVRFEWIDPLPFSAEENSAIAYNLYSANLSRAGEQGYFGLVGTNSLDQIETIPLMQSAREAFLEYDLTRIVLRLSSPTEPVLGVIDGLGVFGSTILGRVPTAMIERLGEDFEVVQLQPDVVAIPDDVDVLMLIHPHNLSDSALYAIDQYVIRGRPLAVYLDPLAQHSPPDPTNRAMPQFPESYLAPLLAAWGAEMVPQMVVGDLDMALEVRAQAGNQIVITDYLPWLVVDQDNLNRDDAVTSQLVLMRISSAGAVRLIDGAATELTPLITTTTNSMLIDQAAVLRRASPDELLNAFVPSRESFVIAGRLTGPASTAFPDGPPEPPPPAEGEEPVQPPELIAESTAPINVVVVTDTDLLGDDHNVNDQGTWINQNSDFVINALDNLIGSSQLIDLRGRGLVFRPFTRVDAFEQEAEQRYRATEQQLQAELADVEAQLADIRNRALIGDEPIGALTRAQQDAIDEYNQRYIELRLELREVQGALGREIDALSTRLELINIAAVPAVVIVIGLLVWLWRRARLSRYLAATRAR
jgi:ABC-type uncharacterized transport system involved in gliding motility auxiliary subunit